MDWTESELAKIHLNSTKNCVHCKAIFPTEYDKCPGCEVEELWKTVKIQYENYTGQLNYISYGWII